MYAVERLPFSEPEIELKGWLFFNHVCIKILKRNTMKVVGLDSDYVFKPLKI